MTTPNLWKSVGTYMSLYQTVSNYPVMFTNSRPRLKTLTGFTSLQFFWVSIFINSFATMCGIFVTIGRWLKIPMFADIPLWKVLFVGGVTAIGIIQVVSHLSLYALGATLSLAFDRFLEMEETLHQGINIEILDEINIFRILGTI